MKKLSYKSVLLSVATSLCAIFSSGSVSAAVDNSVQAECAHDYLMLNFPEPIVRETLKKFGIPEDKWDGIVKSLMTKGKEVFSTIHDKAEAMNPNPMKDRKESQTWLKLYSSTVAEKFSEALQENGITDVAQQQQMLDDIELEKRKRYAMCLNKSRAESAPGQAGTAAAGTAVTKDADKDADEDDEEEDDEDEDEDDDEDDEDEDEDKDAKPKAGEAAKAPVAPAKAAK